MKFSVEYSVTKISDSYSPSRKLLSCESTYSTVEKECLAIKWALDSLRYYLLGRKFRLETDHRALSWLGQMRDTNSIITRWFLAMQPFDFEVLYRSGIQNCTADYLSRTPNEAFEEGGGGGGDHKVSLVTNKLGATHAHIIT